MITIDWPSGVITVPKTDTTLVQLNPTEIRSLDLDTFRLALKSLEASEDGMGFPKTHIHNTEVTLSGVTFARVIEILDPYSITFEDGQYAVNLVNANSNVADKVNVNQVSVRSANSAGLTVPVTAEDLADAVWDEQVSEHQDTGSTGKALSTASTGGVDIGLLADAVWNEPLGDHILAGSAGEALEDVSNSASLTIDDISEAVWDADPTTFSTDTVGDKINTIDAKLTDMELSIKRILGLTQENFRIKDHSYDLNNYLTGATIRIYNSSSDCDSDVNPLAEYQMSATYDINGNLTDYKVTKI